MRIIGIISFCLLSVQISASEVNLDSIKSLIVSDLQNFSDTILVYESGCVGCEVLWDTDDLYCEGSVYTSIQFFWLEGGCLYTKMIDDCGAFKTVQIQNNGLFDFYFQNKTTIQQEKYQVDKHLRIENGDSVYYEIISVHYSFDKIELYDSRNQLIKIESKGYYFDSNSNPLNAEKNKDLMIYAWHNLIAKANAFKWDNRERNWKDL